MVVGEEFAAAAVGEYVAGAVSVSRSDGVFAQVGGDPTRARFIDCAEAVDEGQAESGVEDRVRPAAEWSRRRYWARCASRSGCSYLDGNGSLGTR